MAASQSTPSSLSRRSFIASLGAAGAAVVASVSVNASAAPATWADARSHLGVLRAMLAEALDRVRSVLERG